MFHCISIGSCPSTVIPSLLAAVLHVTESMAFQLQKEGDLEPHFFSAMSFHVNY